MKKIILEPLNDEVSVRTQTRLLDTLTARHCQVAMACGGQGICATCHVYIKQGMDSLTPPTQREKETLSFLTGVKSNSRLACQCRIIGEGLTIEVPEGMYIGDLSEIESLVGRRAENSILHPKDGHVLIEKGKIITKSRISELNKEQVSILDLRAQSSTL